MSRQALNVAVMPRARRGAFAAITSLSVTATAAVAGGWLLNAQPGPLLTVVGEFQPAVQQPLAQISVAVQEDEPAPVIDSLSEATEPAQVTGNSEIRWFNNRPIRPAGTMIMKVTAYSPDEQSCGEWADGITASGYSVWTNGMNLVASDNSILPLGSLVSIPGYDNGNAVPVLDRGGAIKGNRLDVLYPTHERAMQWGVQELEVTIWEYADGKPNDFRQNHRRR